MLFVAHFTTALLVDRIPECSMLTGTVFTNRDIILLIFLLVIGLALGALVP